MKKSIALAIAILILGSLPGFFLRHRLASTSEEHTKLVAEAVRYGVAEADTPDTRSTKRHRVAIGKQAASVVDEIVSLSTEMEQARNRGERGDESFRDKTAALMSKIASLDAATMKQVFASLQENSAISEDTRRNIIGFAIINLAEDHPQSAVALFTEASEILEKSSIGDQVLSSALSRWAQTSPTEALTWLRNNEGKYPEIDGDDAKRAVITGTAVNDPKLAFKLIGEINPDDKSSAVQAILASGQDTAEKRDNTLAALREHLNGIRDEQEREELRSEAFGAFSRNIDSQGFESVTAWLAKSNFTAKEKEDFATGLSYYSTKENTGKWIGWLTENLGAESVTGPVSELVSEWTQQDYQSAGKWLVAAPEGPARTAAVQAYATTVAEYDPKVAAQWAMTLPAGPAREATMQSIYQNWPANDPDGAKNFASEHRLEQE